jgi:hypothetical protein
MCYEASGDLNHEFQHLEGKVFEVIREIMLDPKRLRGCISKGAGLDHRSTARELARVAGKMTALDQDRRQMIDRYAADQMTGEEYIAANRALDQKLEKLVREKAKLAAALRSPQHEDFMDHIVAADLQTRAFTHISKKLFRHL